MKKEFMSYDSSLTTFEGKIKVPPKLQNYCTESDF